MSENESGKRVRFPLKISHDVPELAEFIDCGLRRVLASIQKSHVFVPKVRTS